MKSDTICGQQPVAALFARRPDDVQRLFHVPDLREVAGPFCAKTLADFGAEFDLRAAFDELYNDARLIDRMLEAARDRDPRES